MTIIHSYWSRPGRLSRADRLKGGFQTIRHHLFSWALSCLQFKKFYPEVVLYTDEYGKYLLSDMMQLPYTDVKVSFTDLDAYHPELWAVGKIHAYASQKAPFIHADGDVFIWRRLGDEIEKAPLCAQHAEPGFSFYEPVMNLIEKHFTYIPEAIRQERKNGRAVHSHNCGIIGGSDTAFFQDFTTESLRFIEKNTSSLHHLGPYLKDFLLIFEQYLFSAMARQQDKPIATLFENVVEKDERFIRFRHVPDQVAYIHPISNHKQYRWVGEAIERHLRQAHPEYYHHILNLIAKNKI